MYKLVLMRHGQSVWNLENRFTGWTDVDLAEVGIQEARKAGRLLKEEGYDFDICYTSVLTRAIRTLHLLLEELDRLWLPEVKSWRLNERHYGSLQGLNKAEIARQYGDEQVFTWRRSYDILPPPISLEDQRHPNRDPRYASLAPEELPLAESLRLTVARVLPLWHTNLAPRITSGERLLLVAHGNSIRALVKYLDQVSDTDITGLNIPTGIPLVYELNAALIPITNYYLDDYKTVAAKMKTE